MDAFLQLINEAISEKLRLIDFLREENASLTSRLRDAEARIYELEGDYLGGANMKGENF